MDSDSWIILLVIILLICASAFFSASETAISTFNKIRMKKKADEGDKKAKVVLELWENYHHTLSGILVGNNVVNITASTLAAVVATSLLGPAAGALAATVSITVLVLLFGETMPKSYGKENADEVALKFSGILKIVVAVFYPISFVINKITGLFRRETSGEKSPSITEEELIYMMDAIEEEGVLEEQERDLVQSALEFDEVTLREILTPRVNLVAIDADDPVDEIRSIVVEKGYSRIPVFEKTVDNIIGVLYTRDFLLALLSGGEIRVRDMLGKTLYVHEGMKLSHLLASFKSHKLNLAVVVDEYGGTVGIVTMEDVLEELVGEIWDEDDEIPSGLTETGDNRFEVDGGHGLEDLFETLDIGEPDGDFEFSTVGGWALHTFGHIPAAGETFEFSGCLFTALEMDGHRLRKLGVQLLCDENMPDDGQELTQDESDSQNQA